MPQAAEAQATAAALCQTVHQSVAKQESASWAHAPHKEWQQRVAEWKMVPLTLIAGPFLALATKDRFETDSG